MSSAAMALATTSIAARTKPIANPATRLIPLRQPALAPTVMFRVAVGFAGAGLVEPEIEFLDVGILSQAFGRAFEYDAAVFHDIAVIGDVECQRRVLLDQQHGELLLLLEAVNHAENLLDDHRREAERGFVEQ